MKPDEPRPLAPHPKSGSGAKPVTTSGLHIALASAPFVYSDVAPSAFGYSAGVGHVTLEAFVHAMPDMKPMVGVIPVCHLRMPLAVVRQLREALQAIEALGSAN